MGLEWAQSTFDEAVHDNIETFEMEPDEAVRARRSRERLRCWGG
jgi:hypothetical protein